MNCDNPGLHTLHTGGVVAPPTGGVVKCTTGADRGIQLAGPAAGAGLGGVEGMIQLAGAGLGSG